MLRKLEYFPLIFALGVSWKLWGEHPRWGSR